MSASPVTIPKTTPAERLERLQAEVRALQHQQWQDVLGLANAFEERLEALVDDETMPFGVRDLCRRLAERIAGDLNTAGQIMDRRK